MNDENIRAKEFVDSNSERIVKENKKSYLAKRRSRYGQIKGLFTYYNAFSKETGITFDKIEPFLKEWEFKKQFIKFRRCGAVSRFEDKYYFNEKCESQDEIMRRKALWLKLEAHYFKGLRRPYPYYIEETKYLFVKHGAMDKNHLIGYDIAEEIKRDGDDENAFLGLRMRGIIKWRPGGYYYDEKLEKSIMHRVKRFLIRVLILALILLWLILGIFY